MLNPAGKLRSSPGPSVVVGQIRKGAGPFLAFQRLYLASGGVSLDRCSRSLGNRGKALSPRASLSPRRLFAGSLYVNFGFLQRRTSRPRRSDSRYQPWA
jgi:hypothetical protein